MFKFIKTYINIRKEKRFRKNKTPLIEVWKGGIFDSEGNKSTPAARPQDIWVGCDPATGFTQTFIRRWIKNERNTTNQFRCPTWLKRKKKKS